MLDPATCPVGELDDCCPRLTQGGTDPDCPSLGCTLELGTPIPLTDETTGRKSGTGLAWTGQELVLARLDYRPIQTSSGSQYQDYDILIERRDADGNLVADPVRHEEVDASSSPYGPGAIAFEPESRSLLYAYQEAGYSSLFNFDEQGQKRWGYRSVITACTDRTARITPFAAPGRFVVGADHYTCDFPGDRHSEVQAYTPDGVVLEPLPLNGRELTSQAYNGAYACNGDCSQVLSYYSNSARVYAKPYDLDDDLVGSEVFASGPLYGGVNGTAIAFDGARYFVLSNDYTGQDTSQARFRFFDPDTNSFGSYTTTERIDMEGFTGTMVWTGDGFLAAMALYDLDHVTLAPRNSTRIHIWHLAPDGSLRQSFDLEEEQGLLPELAVLPGKIAITWVRTTAGEQRYLSFFTCAG